MKNISHPFYIMNMSPWPLISSLSLLSSSLFFTFMLEFKIFCLNKIMILIIVLMWSSFMWWKDLKRESSFQGNHTNVFLKLLKHSMLTFILSEIMFFISFFWSFFHTMSCPDINLGNKWPPMNLTIFNQMSIPLLNSIILLSSACFVTWSHHSFIKKNLNSSFLSMLTTIMMGMLFSYFQFMEYKNSTFSFSDSSYGSIFFMTTGFHGIHVLAGSIFLTNSLYMMANLESSPKHFISMELSIWYWHFVDVVWLFLYMVIYCWGSSN